MERSFVLNVFKDYEFVDDSYFRVKILVSSLNFGQ